MDLGLLNGTGGVQPEGIIDQAEAVAGATLIAAVGAGIAEIGEAGGVTDTIALSPHRVCGGADPPRDDRASWSTRMACRTCSG